MPTTIVNLDFRELSSQTIADCMITDPPYSPHTHRSAVSQSAKGGARKRDLGFTHITEELRRATCALANRIPRWSVIFSDLESITLWKDCLEEAGATYIRTVPWVRWSMPQLSGDRPPQGAEAIILAYGNSSGAKSWNGPGNLTHLEHTCLRGEGKHKTEKPLDLMLDLVNWFSNPGETVIDPFAGSGTTGLACRILGRHFIGSEIDSEWATKAKHRIEFPDQLSKRDSERYQRWLATEEIRKTEQARIAAINEKARYKNARRTE
jgi:site-specific DNA-methyltransferase (adenine-specific)